MVFIELNMKMYHTIDIAIFDSISISGWEPFSPICFYTVSKYFNLLQNLLLTNLTNSHWGLGKGACQRIGSWEVLDPGPYPGAAEHLGDILERGWLCIASEGRQRLCHLERTRDGWFWRSLEWKCVLAPRVCTDKQPKGVLLSPLPSDTGLQNKKACVFTPSICLWSPAVGGQVPPQHHCGTLETWSWGSWGDHPNSKVLALQTWEPVEGSAAASFHPPG